MSHIVTLIQSIYEETVNQVRIEHACKTVIEINLFMESAFWECFFEWCAICHRNKDTELESENRKQIFTQLRKYSTQYAREGAEWTAHNQNLTAVAHCEWTSNSVCVCMFVHACLSVSSFNQYSTLGQSTWPGPCGYRSAAWWWSVKSTCSTLGAGHQF